MQHCPLNGPIAMIKQRLVGKVASWVARAASQPGERVYVIFLFWWVQVYKDAGTAFVLNQKTTLLSLTILYYILPTVSTSLTLSKCPTLPLSPPAPLRPPLPTTATKSPSPAGQTPTPLSTSTNPVRPPYTSMNQKQSTNPYSGQHRLRINLFPPLHPTHRP